MKTLQIDPEFFVEDSRDKLLKLGNTYYTMHLDHFSATVTTKDGHMTLCYHLLKHKNKTRAKNILDLRKDKKEKK